MINNTKDNLEDMTNIKQISKQLTVNTEGRKLVIGKITETQSRINLGKKLI